MKKAWVQITERASPQAPGALSFGPRGWNPKHPPHLRLGHGCPSGQPTPHIYVPVGVLSEIPVFRETSKTPKICSYWRDIGLRLCGYTHAGNFADGSPFAHVLPCAIPSSPWSFIPQGPCMVPHWAGRPCQTDEAMGEDRRQSLPQSQRWTGGIGMTTGEWSERPRLECGITSLVCKSRSVVWIRYIPCI